MSILKIAKGLQLPVEMVTQTASILGKRGVGKTNTSVVITEEMLAADQQVVILDPLDVWFGLRSSVDGKAPGFAITVLGGEHGDLPLEAEARKGKPRELAVDMKALQKAREEGRTAGYTEAQRAAEAKAAQVRKSIGTAAEAIARALAMDGQKLPAPQVRAIPPVRELSRPAFTPARGRILEDSASSNGRLAVGEKRILTACAQYPRGAARDQLTVLTGYKRSSRDTYLQRLQSRGYVDIGPSIMATAEGIAALGADFSPLPTGAELREYWLQRLPESERKIFAALVGIYPGALARDSLEETTGYKRSSRDTYIQRLRSRQLVEVLGRGELRASEELFG